MRGNSSAGGGEVPADLEEQLAAQRVSGEEAPGLCGCLSRLLFLWPAPLFVAANQRPPGGGPPKLELRSLFKLGAGDRVDPLTARFEALLAEAVERALSSSPACMRRCCCSPMAVPSSMSLLKAAHGRIALLALASSTW